MLTPQPDPLVLRAPLAGASFFLQATAPSCVRLQLAPAKDATDDVPTVSGVALPAEPNRTSGEDPLALWLSPGSWLLVSRVRSAEALMQATSPLTAMRTVAITDLSHALLRLELRGRTAIPVLARACGLDLRLDAFAVGHCAGTRFAQLTVHIHRIADEAFAIYVDRSYAAWLWEWLAGRECARGS